MAERNEQVLDRVRKELGRQRDIGSRQLYELAKQMDPSLEDSSLPQFHARYVLPILREHAQQRRDAEGEQAPKQPRKRAGRQTGGAGRASAQAASTRSKPGAAEQEAPTAPRGRRGGAAGREHVRAVFLDFAREFADADSRTEIVQVLSKVDEYVDRVVR